MIWIIIVLAVPLWLVVGRLGAKLTQLTTTTDVNNRGLNSPFFYLFGAWILLLGLLTSYDSRNSLLMTRKDKRNPFHTELNEALRQYRLLQWVPGEEASKQRAELKEDIAELRSWPARLKEHDGDRLIAAMKAELEQSHELRRDRLEAYERIEQQVTEGVHDELNP